MFVRFAFVVATTLSLAGVAYAQPDLVVGDIDVPSEVELGETFNFECRVDNEGQGAAGSSRVGFYLLYVTTSGSTTLVELGDDPTPSLDPGETDRTSDNVELPDDLDPDQPVAAICRADHEDDVNESDEGNNSEVAQISVTGGSGGGLPDLVVGDIDVPSEVELGETFNFECRVDNEGQGAAGSSRVGFYLLYVTTSGSTTLVELGDDPTPSLDPGETDRTSDNVELPDDLDPDQPVAAICRADHEDDVSEADEENNSDVAQISVTGGADPASVGVAVTSVSPTSVAVGETVTVTCRVTNSGGAPTVGSFEFGASLVDGSGNDVVLGRQTVSSLAMGQSRTESFSGPVPPWAPPGGTISAGCATDYVDDDISDNVDTVDLQIDGATEPASVSVNVTDVSPSPAPPSGTVSVTCSITNSGEAATNGAATFGASLASLDGQDSAFLDSESYVLSGGQTRSGTFSGPVPDWAAPGSTIRAGCSTSYNDGDIADNVDSVDLQIETTQGTADLSVVASVTPGEVEEGGAVTVACAVSNAPGSPAVENASVEASLGNSDRSMVVGSSSLPTLAGGATETVSYEDTVPDWATPGSSLTLTCTVSSSDDPNSVNNTGTATLAIAGPQQSDGVFVQAVEFNQGAQDRLLTPTASPVVIDPTEDIPLIPGRDLIVRYYLLDRAAGADGVAATLEVTTQNGTRTLTPNAGSSTVDVPPDPGPDDRDRAVFEQRRDPELSLNFVVPGGWTDEAANVTFDLVYNGEPISTHRFTNIQADRTSLSIGVVRILNSEVNECSSSGACDPDGGVPVQDIYDFTFDYPRAALPFSSITVSNPSPWQYDPAEAREQLRERYRNRTDLDVDELSDCQLMLYALLAYIGERNLDPSSHYVNLGFASDCAIGFTPRTGKSNVPGHAITPPLGETAAHEIGHTIGLKHVSETFDSNGRGDHNEKNPQQWGYSHGLMGDGIDEFGAYAIPRDPSNPDGTQWDLYIVDPCRTESFDDRQGGCDLEDDGNIAAAPHDLMSYGRSTHPFADELHVGRIAGRPYGRWVSPLNFRRMHWAAVTRSAPAAPRRAAPVRAHVVYAAIPPAGLGVVSPLVSRDADPVTLTEDTEGSYTVEFVARDGRVLRSVTTTALQVQDSESDIAFVHALVPYHPEVVQVVVREGSAVRAESPAPQTAPSIGLLSPGPGDVVALSDTVRVRWSSSDADGDPLSVLVEYSSSGGDDWISAGFVDASDRVLPLPASAFGEGEENIVRLTVTDGALTSSVTSQAAFAVTAQPTSTFEPAAPRPFLSSPEPNPTAGATNVRLSLTEPSDIRVSVYDVLGREVLVGFDGRVGAGSSRVRLDVAHLPVGVYLIRATIGGPAPQSQTTMLTISR